MSLRRTWVPSRALFLYGTAQGPRPREWKTAGLSPQNPCPPHCAQPWPLFLFCGRRPDTSRVLSWTLLQTGIPKEGRCPAWAWPHGSFPVFLQMLPPKTCKTLADTHKPRASFLQLKLLHHVQDRQVRRTDRFTARLCKPSQAEAERPGPRHFADHLPLAPFPLTPVVASFNPGFKCLNLNYQKLLLTFTPGYLDPICLLIFFKCLNPHCPALCLMQSGGSVNVCWVTE